MNIKIAFLVLCSVICFSVGQAKYNYCQAPGINPSQNTSGLVLQLVQVVTRHGDRTPTQLLPIENEVWNCSLNWLDIFSDDTFNVETPPQRLYRRTYLSNRELLPGNCSLGQLTEKGIQQHLQLGAELRSLYVDQYQFLPPQLDLNSIWVRSTDVPRTFQSAMANLWALYPPATRPDGTIGIIDLHTMDGGNENMYDNGNCPRYTQRALQLQNTTAWTNHVAKYAPLANQVAQIFDVSSPPTWSQLVDNLEARLCHELPFPKGITAEMLEEFMDAASWELNYLWNDPIIGRLGLGDFLGEIFDRILGYIGGDNTVKYFYYSGHDSTVGPLSALIGGFDGMWPPYASHIEFELWSTPDNTNYFVQVKYNGQPAQTSGCSSVMCPFDEWKIAALNMIPTNWQKECVAMY